MDQQTQSPQPATSHAAPIILAVLITAIVVGGVMYFLMRDGDGGQPPNATPTPTLEPTSTPGPAATWKTYRNEGAGLELQYPPTWVATEPPGDTLVTIRNSQASTGGTEPLHYYLWAQEWGSLPDYNYTTTSVGSYVAHQALTPSQSGAISYFIEYPQTTSKYLEISFSPYDPSQPWPMQSENLAIFDDILSSVVLSAGQTTGWSTYSYEDSFAFSIDYPSNFYVDDGKPTGTSFVLDISDKPFPPETSGRGGDPLYLRIHVGLLSEAHPCESVGGVSSGTIAIGSRTVTKCLIDGGYFGQGTSLFAEATFSDTQYIFRADYYDENQATVDDMLKTFIQR